MTSTIAILQLIRTLSQHHLKAFELRMAHFVENLNFGRWWKPLEIQAFHGFGNKKFNDKSDIDCTAGDKTSDKTSRAI